MAEESKDQESKRNRPLLARTSIIVNAPQDITDEELAEKLKSFSHWTNPSYTTGPSGTVVDIPGGLDFP